MGHELRGTTSNGPLTDNSRFVAFLTGEIDPAPELIPPSLVRDYVQTLTDTLYPTKAELSSLSDYVTAFTLQKDQNDGHGQWEGQSLRGTGFADGIAAADLATFGQLQQAVLNNTFSIPGLDTLASLDSAADLLLIYDTSAGVNKKITPDALIAALDPDLGEIAALTPANDDVIQQKAGAWTNRTMAQLISDLGALGTTFQPLDADLSAIGALAKADGNIIVGDGATWVAESGATARTSLGLGTGDSPQFSTIELGHATQNTLSASGGVLSIEGEALAKLSALASTSNGLGASLIGIQDAGGLITATTVEGALAEHRALINALDQAVILKGTWDASSGSFPGAGAAQAGWSYIVSVGGTVDGTVFTANDRIVAILDNASTATYASSWHKLDYTDQVLSVAGKTGAVTLQVADITDMSANGRSLVSAADYAAMRALLDLEAGTDFYSITAADAAFQPKDADLTSWAGVTRVAGFDPFVATPSSANLASLVTDETGSGSLVFGTGPSIAGATLTGVLDAGGADSFELPNSAAPTVNADGEIALDTSVTDFSHGILKYYGGEEMAIIAVPIAQLTSPTNNFAVMYDATADEFQLKDPAAAAGATTALDNLASVAINTTLVSDTNNTDDLGTSSIAWRTAYIGTQIELGHASDTTLSRAAAGKVAVEGVNLLRTAGNENLTGGFTATSYDNGTKTTGTLTPDALNGPMQHYVNGGAHTLAPPSNPSTIVLECTNSSAGALTTSGFSIVTGDTYSETGTKKHLFFITKTNSYSHLHVVYVTGT